MSRHALPVSRDVASGVTAAAEGLPETYGCEVIACEVIWLASKGTIYFVRGFIINVL